MLLKREYKVGAVLALFAGLALGINLISYLSPDTGWLLYATGRWLRGETLYRDIMETNPPLIMWLNAVPVQLAQWLGVNAVTMFDICVTLLLVFCTALAYGELRRQPIFSQAFYADIMLFAIAVPLFLSPSFVFGQREHLWVMLIAPYIAQSLLLEQEPRGRRQWLIAALAAVGFSLKPFFVILWAANELFLAARARKPRWLFRPTNLIIGIFGLTYIALVAFLYPNYFNEVLPMLAASYPAYKAPLLKLLKVTALFCALYLLPVLFTRSMPRWRSVTAQMLVLFAAACAVHLIQQKGWYNHYYPMLFFGAWLTSVTLIRLLDPWLKDNPPSRWMFALFCLVATTLVLPVCELNRLWSPRGSDPVIESLKTIISERAGGKNVMALSFNLKAAFPLMNEADAYYPSRFHHLWMIPALVMAKANEEPLSPRLEATRAYALAAVRADVKKYLPALVWVDNNNGLDGVFHGFDLIKFFSQDKEFAKLWRQYKRLAVVKEPLAPGEPDAEKKQTSYTVYIRK